MKTIKELNAEYVKVKFVGRKTYLAYEQIKQIQNSDGNSQIEKLEKSLSVLDVLDIFRKENETCDLHYIADITLIGHNYLQCYKTINEYRDNLNDYAIVSSSGNQKVVKDSAQNVKNAENDFIREKENFFQRYNEKIDSIEKLNQTFAKQLERQLYSIQEIIEGLQAEAKIIIDSEPSIEMSRNKGFSEASTLPEIITLAKYPVKDDTLTILKDMKIQSINQCIFGDIRNNGNILINTSFEYMDCEDFDKLVVSYVLRFIEAFPLGSLNVHIFDRTVSFIFRRLCNCFESEDLGESAKKIIQIHTNLADIEQFDKVICPDIFKKTSVSIPDLYAIHENDQSDPFNLIILTNGLVDNSGYASTGILETINSMTRNNDIGHKSGLRFLIIDDSVSFEKSLNTRTKFLVKSIKENCAQVFTYDKGNFFYGSNKVEMIHIADDVDAFVQERSQEIAELISKKEKNYVSISEINGNQIKDDIGSIITIPVGVAGNISVELPLSCKDENGTVAGQCIGYMVIGQSGSGKSSFFHSIVLNGCLQYSPRDLQFWLLDFKYGGASSKYSSSGLPHIRIIAENNKIDDALCLFQMISEEMDRRNKAFNNNFVDNILDYNRIASKTEGMEYFPRIIIAIDEVQEIFREDNASVIQKLISSISVRMRSAGMHFIMVAQNLSEGKSYMLKEAFLPSASGRVCFRVSENIPRDSGFDDDFIQRKQEITELKTGEAYISYGKGTIKKVKIAYASADDMIEQYFPEIRKKYPDFSDMKPMVIGSKRRLTINTSLQNSDRTYCEVIRNLQPINGIYNTIVGEDSYRMIPMLMDFSQYENSATMFLGSDKEIASSLCTSVALSLINQDATVHMFNGDKSRVQDGYKSLPHSFMYLCQKLPGIDSHFHSYVLSQFSEVIKKLYKEYLERQSLIQQSDDDENDFPPIFLIVNDLFGIESFVSNDIVENAPEELPQATAERNGRNYDFLSMRSSSGNAERKKGYFKEPIQNLLTTLMKSGYRYNIHIILAIRGDPSTWRSSRIASEILRACLFNSTQYTDQFDNSYYLKEMLRNITNENGIETMAVFSNKRQYSKVRPIIYKLFNNQELESIDALMKRG